MADFNAVLVAKRALEISVGSIFADASLNEAARVDALRKDAIDYAKHLRLPLADAEESVAKSAEKAGAPSDIIRKAKRSVRELTTAEGPGELITPDPALVEPKEKPMRRATKAEIFSVTREAVAAEVAKIRAEHPGLSEHQARERFYGANPGVRKSLVELSGREYGQLGPSQELAKQGLSSSAQIEAAGLAAEIMKSDGCTEHQAYDRAFARTPGLFKRLMTRG